MNKEIKELTREIKKVRRGLEDLEIFRSAIESDLRDLGEISGGNLYVNYSQLRMGVQDAVDDFYRKLRKQMGMTISRLETERYELALKESEKTAEKYKPKVS